MAAAPCSFWAGTWQLHVGRKTANLTDATEEIHPIETQGEWWFDEAEPDTEYMAEIGFYATNRPYFRVLYSNTITTPRRSPSAHPAAEAHWTVSATKFAEVLTYRASRAMLSMSRSPAKNTAKEERTKLAFSELMNRTECSKKDITQKTFATRYSPSPEVRRGSEHRATSSLFTVLQANAERLSSSRAREV